MLINATLHMVQEWVVLGVYSLMPPSNLFLEQDVICKGSNPGSGNKGLK